MTGFIIALVVVIGTAGWAVAKEEYNGYILGMIGGVALVVLSIFAAMLLTGKNLDNTPIALDEYRGKTTLEITYKDSVALDSVVVFKDEFLKQ